MSTYIINKYYGLFFLAFLAANSLAQDSLLIKEPAVEFSPNNVIIKYNDFYYNENRVDAGCLSKLINSSTGIDQYEKIKLIEGIKKYKEYKGNKNAFTIIASSTFILGAGFSFLTFIEGGRSDVFILSAIFGTVSVGFTFGSIISGLKFKKRKKELILELAL
ncbi:MAG: hypothetical protein H7141_10025 [Burkholderiales bacterium]|nr:hypothetical protein [Bacteroidia bacterium]